MKIATIIVTFNRLALLKECIEAVQNQSLKSDEIIVINNSSTDGTDKYLDSLSDSSICHVNLDKNIGGAGGFSYGIKMAAQRGYDYFWVMDDDCVPQREALENLSKAFSVADNVGFTSSKVIWTDGTPHKMNLHALMPTSRSRTTVYNQYSQTELPVFLVKNATFVSTMISAEAVRSVGLPIADFFIWHDDIEYTERICSNGYIGLYVDNSVAVHKTKENYYAQPQTADASIAWKFYYQARNTTYVKRVQKHKNKIVLFFSALNSYRVFVHRLKKRPNKSGNNVFKRYYRKGLIDGLTFNPEIEKI